MQGVPGVKDLMVEQQVEIPQLQIKLDRDAAAALRPDLRRRQRVHRDGDERPHRLGDRPRDSGSSTWSCGWTMSTARIRQRSSGCRSICPRGGRVPLDRRSPTSSRSSGPNTINRENVRRRIVIQCNTAGRDLDSVVTDIQKRLDADPEVAADRLFHRVRRPVRKPAQRHADDRPAEPDLAGRACSWRCTRCSAR